MRIPYLVATTVTVFSLLTNAIAVRKQGASISRRSDTQQEQKKTAARKEYEDGKKYFHEPGQDDLLGHYDTRYFTELVSYEEKRFTQLHMIRAYLDTFREKGIETWIAHGTLLGWWWNSKVTQLEGWSLWRLTDTYLRDRCFRGTGISMSKYPVRRSNISAHTSTILFIPIPRPPINL